MRNNEEHLLTVQVAQYLEMLKTIGKVIVFTKTTQEVFTKSWGTKMRNKQEGLRAGLQDLIVVTPTTVLFLELKKSKGGVISEHQQAWNLALQGRTGISAVIAHGWDEAKAAIDSACGVQ
jgi:hypothetical protein